jgi:hypothetical protein
MPLTQETYALKFTSYTEQYGRAIAAIGSLHKGGYAGIGMNMPVSIKIVQSGIVVEF